MTVNFNRGPLSSMPSKTPFVFLDDPHTLWMLCEPGGGFSWSLTPGKRGAVNLHTGAVTERDETEVVEFREASVVNVV